MENASLAIHELGCAQVTMLYKLFESVHYKTKR